MAGVLDQHPFEDPAGRAWGFRTVGRGHGVSFWASFLEALREVGYDDVVSIENEDEWQPAEEGVREAAEFMRPLIGPSPL